MVVEPLLELIKKLKLRFPNKSDEVILELIKIKTLMDISGKLGMLKR